MPEFVSVVKEGNSARLSAMCGTIFLMSDDTPMPAWAKRLNEKVEEFGWPEPDRARLLSERTGGSISADLFRKYLEGGVDQPRGNNMAKVAEAIGLSEVELRGLEPIRKSNDPLTNASIPSAGGVESLAKMEAELERFIKDVWIEIGALRNRIEQLESGAVSAKKDNASLPTKAR